MTVGPLSRRLSVVQVDVRKLKTMIKVDKLAGTLSVQGALRMDKGEIGKSWTGCEWGMTSLENGHIRWMIELGKERGSVCFSISDLAPITHNQCVIHSIIRCTRADGHG